MSKRLACLLAIALGSFAQPLTAQGVVVDQGQFAITVEGRSVGREEFVIRRAGLGRDNAVFANGIVRVEVDGTPQEARPLLRASTPDGIAQSYQVRVVGAEAVEIRMNQAGGRHIARISSAIGEEDREFPAHPDTRVLELGVAHHYYFLRDVRPGQSVHVIIPRARTQTELVVGDRTDEEIRLGRNVVQARRVQFTSGDDVRVVWYDRQGRVLRVRVPATGYLAERIDLVG